MPLSSMSSQSPVYSPKLTEMAREPEVSRTFPDSQIRWMLKYAQPGKALVSQKGNDDMISVSVGDHLPGLGKVEAIEAIDGKWVVQGSVGRVTQ